ncbi:hypothetical protein HW555_002616 [Spodoptera exigua]|uniref:Uncharacterized protein n=1 Tax=Spodoptera exigua TaxID=7107 RepID=A0A835L980_SPOEX|nr:hypothetical protein HW555_002616 [Spodoptera exigua]
MGSSRFRILQLQPKILSFWRVICRQTWLHTKLAMAVMEKFCEVVWTHCDDSQFIQVQITYPSKSSFGLPRGRTRPERPIGRSKKISTRAERASRAAFLDWVDGTACPALSAPSPSVVRARQPRDHMNAWCTPRGVSGGVNNSVPFSATNDAVAAARRRRTIYVRDG